MPINIVLCSEPINEANTPVVKFKCIFSRVHICRVPACVHANCRVAYFSSLTNPHSQPHSRRRDNASWKIVICRKLLYNWVPNLLSLILYFTLLVALMLVPSVALVVLTVVNNSLTPNNGTWEYRHNVFCTIKNYL